MCRAARTVFIFNIILVACGSQHAAREPAPPPLPASTPPADAAPPPQIDAARPIDTSGSAPDAPPPPLDAAPPHHADMTCPKKLEAAEGICDPDGIGTCKYGQVICTCEPMMDCSGTDGPPSPSYWHCRKPPPKTRPDGCPGVIHHGRCAKQGQVCAYESGCCQVIFECRGTWERKSQQCPM